MDVNLLREAVTVLSFLAFVGIVAYAAHPGNRAGFEEAARLPLDDDGPSPQPSPTPRSTPRAPEGEQANVGQVFTNREHE